MSMRRCGTRSSTGRAGLAVPMSSPRYTSAESTLTISTGALSASAIAQSLLPEPVGPVSTNTGSRGPAGAISAAPQEQLVELLQAEAGPGRTAVVALVGAVGGLHLAQQAVHFRQAEAAVGVYRAAAGERAEEAVGGAVEVVPARLERQLVHQLADDARQLACIEDGRHAAQGQARGRQRLQ